MAKQILTVLGATGSIGVNTLDVVRQHREQFEVYALVASKNAERMRDLVIEFEPKIAVMACAEAAEKLQLALAQCDTACVVASGDQSIVEVSAATAVTTVVAAIVGAAGLRPTLAAVERGKRVLLANKESLVMAGRLFMDTVYSAKAELLPVDSEHNAIFQCLPRPFMGLQEAGVESILLTGSGGPFRTVAPDKLADVTVAQACAHPNWEMGQKISVDSATMMNKGLEFIEACWLFGARAEQVEVLIHPQSVVHSMLRYVDGSVLAQLGQPDMRTPIAHCLAWPERISSGVEPLSFTDFAQLSFEPPDYERFPCLKLAQQCFTEGGSYPAALNAANEVAVESFLTGKIAFTQIAQLVGAVIENWCGSEPDSLEAVLAADNSARDSAYKWLRDCGGVMS